MATKTVPEYNALIGAHVARAAAMISAIEAICTQLEDACGDAREGFDLTTAVEACAQVAREELSQASAAQDAISKFSAGTQEEVSA